MNDPGPEGDSVQIYGIGVKTTFRASPAAPRYGCQAIVCQWTSPRCPSCHLKVQVNAGLQLVAYLTSDDAAFITGAVISIDGGTAAM